MNVASLAERPRAPRTEREAWTLAEVRAFIGRADQDRHAALWRVALSTGVRRGELLGLWWGDIDLEERLLTVRRQVLVRGSASSSAPRLYLRETTKERRPRTVRFDEATRDALAAWRITQEQDRRWFSSAWHADGGLGVEAAWLATEANGMVVHPDTLHDRFERLAKAAGVRRLVLQGARHTFATLSLASGVRADLVSRALGHASTGFTLDVYTHPSGEEELAAADRIGEALGGGREGGMNS
jgi:integrase